MKQEIETLQNTITSLTLQLRTSEENNERLKGNSHIYILSDIYNNIALLSRLKESVSGHLHHQEFEEIQTKSSQEKESTLSISEKTSNNIINYANKIPPVFRLDVC